MPAPSPHPLNFSKISGVSDLRKSDRQNSSQNIRSKDFAKQNPESTGFTGRFFTAAVLVDIAAYASSAGTMMERIGGCGQGRMSQGIYGFFRGLSRRNKWGASRLTAPAAKAAQLMRSGKQSYISAKSLEPIGSVSPVKLPRVGHPCRVRYGWASSRTELPITEWPALVETWLHTIGMISD
jgi:hypothetical protein